MEGLVAVQVLVTVAVLPAVVSDLGGVRLFGAALSSSQVATVIVLPFTPRLVSRWGLRGAFYASMGAFVAGSLVVISAPAAWGASMTEIDATKIFDWTHVRNMPS